MSNKSSCEQAFPIRTLAKGLTIKEYFVAEAMKAVATSWNADPEHKTKIAKDAILIATETLKQLGYEGN